MHRRTSTADWIPQHVGIGFSIHTTAGFGDVSPAGAWPCVVASLESLRGVLHPATRSGPIAARPAAGESGTCR